MSRCGDRRSDVPPRSRPRPVDSPIRPREFSLLAMSIESRMPWKLRKKREAHHEVQELKLKLLDHIVSVDPEPDEIERVLFDAALEESVDGPARGVVSDILFDWEMVRTSPRTALWMVEQATREPEQRCLRGRAPADGPTTTDGPTC